MFQPQHMGIYIHWPFCVSKCPYCDFNVHVRETIDFEQWSDAYLKVLEFYAQLLPDRHIVSVFFGGGTPSIMPPVIIEKILNKIKKSWLISNDLEITLEANPTTIESQKLLAFKDAGVNRISLGIQSLLDSELKFLGRNHSSADAIKAIEIVRQNFEKFNIDLIYARPNQTLKNWEQELYNALKYVGGHLSLYQLTVERNTPFYMQYNRGEFILPDDVVGADLYKLTQNITKESGLPAYEISNHAKSGHECRHNLLYWHYADYIGIGPGAHGRYKYNGNKLAVRDHSAPNVWLERVFKKQNGAHPVSIISEKNQFEEILMMGFRLKSGISIKKIKLFCGIDFYEKINQEHLKKSIQEGWINITSDMINLTEEGILRINSLIPYILK